MAVGRHDTELRRCTARAADLVVPPPATMAVLASRAQQRASVFRAADELTTADFGIIAALAGLGAVDAAVPRSALLEALDGRLGVKSTDRILDKLRGLLLVWVPPSPAARPRIRGRRSVADRPGR